MTTSTAQGNVELMKRGYDCFAGGDLETLRSELLAPDIVWHVGGDNPTSGDYEGVEQVLGLFMNYFELTGGTFRAELREMVAAGDLVFGIGVAQGTRKGTAISEEPYCHVARVRDGKMAEAWILNLDQATVDAFYRA